MSMTLPKRRIRFVAIFLLVVLASSLLIFLIEKPKKALAVFPTNNTVLDNFNRANEDPLATSSSGPSWSTTTLSGTGCSGRCLSVNGNSARADSTSTTNSQYLNGSNIGPDSEAYVTITATGGSASGTEICSLYARMNSVGTSSVNGYELEVTKGSSSNWIVYQETNSSVFNELGVLASTTGSRQSQTISANDAIGMQVTGSGATVTVTGWYKASGGSWSQIGTWTDSSSGRHTSAGKLGLEVQGNATNPQLDDFSGGTVLSNVAPAAPTLVSPLNAATNTSAAPLFQLRATDADNDYLRYKIQLCQDSLCNTVLNTFDETSSQTNWLNQDQQSGTAYTGSSTITSSTIASFLVPNTVSLSLNTTYYWRAYAIDPAGTNTFSTASSIQSFTTVPNSTNVQIKGGTTVQGGSVIE